MSKLSPLGQSMAALFTPESQKLRAGEKKAAGNPRAPAGSIKIPGAQNITSHKPGDSLGNPNSPGYEPWGKKKESQETATEEKLTEAGPGGVVIETTSQGPDQIRLSAGWEKLLLTQKKICEKAKGLFTRLEGPPKYNALKKSKLLLIKSRGCIVDLDSQTTQDEKEAALKKAKDSA